jgi:hypothetical protein
MKDIRQRQCFKRLGHELSFRPVPLGPIINL